MEVMEPFKYVPVQRFFMLGYPCRITESTEMLIQAAKHGSEKLAMPKC